MTTSAPEIDYANTVGLEEMSDSRQHLTSLIETLTTVGETTDKRVEVTCVSQGWGKLQRGRSVARTPLCLAGRTFAMGLGTHAESEIVVRLPVGARRLTGLCGVNDSPETRQNAKALVFSVEVDGTPVWQSGSQTVADEPAPVNVPLPGCRRFTLRVKGPIPFAHANWVDLKVKLANGKSISLCGRSNADGGFSFVYRGKSSTELLPTWRLKKQRLPEKDGIILHRITRTDPKTGLAVICEIKEYTRFPVVEWVVRLKNTSPRKTPLLENIRSLDVSPNIGQNPYLNYWTGDYCHPDGYEPFRVSLGHEEEYRFAPEGGRGTNRAWPYYNLECPDSNRGLIIVIGWPGQWASCFRGLDDHAVHICAGQELTHFKLLPGEEARTPLSVLMFYRGDRMRSRNLWRRWYLTHTLPRHNGQPMKPHLACATTDTGEEFTAATEENQIRYIGKFNEHGIHPDVWWIDAGWYPCRNAEGDRRWPLTGTWEPDPERFPNGLKPISDCAARNGADLLLWFEPERVTPGSKLDREHPDWLLRVGDESNRLLNLGHPKCRQWLTDHVCKLIRDNGIKIYRQDFNFAPLAYWRQNEAGDRQGLNENFHVQGYLRYWDDLLARNPGLWIDSCASGGRRNDLETMRRSVPLHYTDYGYGDHPVKLAFHHTLYEWIPYFKEFTSSWDLGEPQGYQWDRRVDSYSFHCGLAPMLFTTLDIRREDYDFALAQKMIALWRRAADLLLTGDYYPLTPYHRSPDQWVARQFDRPEEGRGLLQAIRLPKASATQLIVYPHALDPETVYRFENPETGETRELTGAVVQQDGFIFALPKREGTIWFYQAQKTNPRPS